MVVDRHINETQYFYSDYKLTWSFIKILRSLLQKNSSQLFIASLVVYVEVILEVPTPSLVVANNDIVEMLRAKLAKCKSNHKSKLELVYFEYANTVQAS